MSRSVPIAGPPAAGEPGPAQIEGRRRSLPVAEAASTADLEATTPWVRRWLRAEGLAAFVGGFFAWRALDGGWPWFLVFLLLPDVSAIGYLASRHVGAITYNIAHNWFTGGAVLGLGLALAFPALTMAGIVLVAHTGIDRVLGYGLKYPTSFQDTHLGHIGKR